MKQAPDDKKKLLEHSRSIATSVNELARAAESLKVRVILTCLVCVCCVCVCVCVCVCARVKCICKLVMNFILG